MSGKWVLKLPQPHYCDRPKIDSCLVIGSIWQCDCGNLFRCAVDPTCWSPGWWEPISPRKARRALRKAKA